MASVIRSQDEAFNHFFFPDATCSLPGQSRLSIEEAIEVGIAFAEALLAYGFHAHMASRHIRDTLDYPIMVTADEFLIWSWLSQSLCLLRPVPGAWTDRFFRPVVNRLIRPRPDEPSSGRKRHTWKLQEKLLTTLTCLLRWIAPTHLDVAHGIDIIHAAGNTLRSSRSAASLRMADNLLRFTYIGNGRFLNGAERGLATFRLLGIDPDEALPRLIELAGEM